MRIALWNKMLLMGLLSMLLMACSQPGQTAVDSVVTPPPVAMATVTITPLLEPSPTTAVMAPATVMATVAPATLVPTAIPDADENLYKGIPHGLTAEGAPTLGFTSAPVTLIDYSDFLCAACQRHALAIEPDIIETYVRSGRVQLVFRPVLNHGVRSLRSAEAAACAAAQNQFWPMHQLLFEQQAELLSIPEEDLLKLMMVYAAALELDQNAFGMCMVDGAALARVQAFDAEQRGRGINVQPVFEINDQRLIGFQSFEVFQRVIEAVQ